MGVREQIAKDREWSAAPVFSSVPSVLRLVETHAPEASPRLPVRQPTHGTLRLAMKRALDLSIATFLLILLAPLLAVIAVLIRLDSTGPALFRQTRLGQNGKPFRIVKFRSLYVLEDGENLKQVQKNDARITRVGRWLRKSSLDELPQLINVFKGEMSLVGPRPHAISHDRYFARKIGDYERRQLVKPGITGWAQIHGLRGETSTVEDMRKRVAFDLWYVENASALLDLRILIDTPGEVLRQRNAH